MHIESFFPGRLRVRSDLFTRPENYDRVVDYVNAIDGIRDISGNLRTGSVTVVYDPKRISMEMLMQAKEELERLEAELN